MKNVLKSYLSCAMCLVLLGGSLSKVNVSAAEIVKLQANGEGSAPSKLNLAIQMLYSCRSLKNKIIEVGNNFKIFENEADQDIIFNQIEIVENKCCTLRSIIVNIGHLFIIWVLN